MVLPYPCLAEFAASYCKKIVNDKNKCQGCNLPILVDSDDNCLMQLFKSIKPQTFGKVLFSIGRKVVFTEL